MAPDGLAILSEVEDEFEIEVSERLAAHSDTVGELADVVHSRLRQDPEDPCPAQHLFYVVRKQLMGRLGLPRAAIRPETSLEELFPRASRPSLWSELLTSLRSRERERAALVRSSWLNRTVFLLLPALVFLITLVLVPIELSWLGILLALGVARLADRCTAAFKLEFPPGLSRAEDLVRFVATLDCKVWSREEVLERVRHLTNEQPAIHPAPAPMAGRRYSPR